MLGLFVFFYTALHFTIFLVLDLELAFGDLGREVARRPYTCVGFASLVILIALAATSTDRAIWTLGRHPGDALPSVHSRHARVPGQGNEDFHQQVHQETALVSWEIVYTRDACKDAKKIQAAGLRARVDALLAILRINPFQNPPSFEKLVGDLSGGYFRRITIKHRLVYQVFKAERTVKILRMWTHHE